MICLYVYIYIYVDMNQKFLHICRHVCGDVNLFFFLYFKSTFLSYLKSNPSK